MNASLTSPIDAMLGLAEDIRALAVSFGQLPSLNDRYSLYAEYMLTTSQRLIDILAVGVGCEREQLRHFAHDCRAPFLLIRSYSELCRETDLLPLPPAYINIMQHILETVDALQDCLDDLNDEAGF